MNAIKKLAPAERRKLERRLPLWEAAFKTADREDRKMLKKKIDNARSILNMSPIVLALGENVKVKHKEIITERAPKREVSYRKTESNKLTGKGKVEYTIDDILFMKNKEKLSDVSIMNKCGFNATGFQRFKRENIEVIYVNKDDQELTPAIYCNIKNDTEMSDSKVIKMYNIESQSRFSRWKLKLIEFKFYPRKELESGSEDYLEAQLYCKLIEKHGFSIKQIGDYLNIPKSTITARCKKLIKQRYFIKNPMRLTPELYCHEKNKNRLSDQEIADKYSIKHLNKITRLKNKFIEVKFLKKSID